MGSHEKTLMDNVNRIDELEEAVKEQETEFSGGWK